MATHPWREKFLFGRKQLQPEQEPVPTIDDPPYGVPVMLRGGLFVLLDKDFDEDEPIADPIDRNLIGPGCRWNRARAAEEDWA